METLRALDNQLVSIDFKDELERETDQIQTPIVYSSNSSSSSSGRRRPPWTSPSIQRRILDIKESKVQHKQKNVWRSCCFVVNKSMFKYATQCIICAMVLMFSMAQLFMGAGEDKSVYFSLISGILGLFSPGPSLEDKKDEGE